MDDILTVKEIISFTDLKIKNIIKFEYIDSSLHYDLIKNLLHKKKLQLVDLFIEKYKICEVINTYGGIIYYSIILQNQKIIDYIFSNKKFILNKDQIIFYKTACKKYNCNFTYDENKKKEEKSKEEEEKSKEEEEKYKKEKEKYKKEKEKYKKEKKLNKIILLCANNNSINLLKIKCIDYYLKSQCSKEKLLEYFLIGIKKNNLKFLIKLIKIIKTLENIPFGIDNYLKLYIIINKSKNDNFSLELSKIMLKEIEKYLIK
jgi:hypothetical protein